VNTFGGNIYDGIQPSGVDDVQGWNSRLPIFGDLIREVMPTTIIEVGTWLGASAIHMATHCKKVGLPATIWCVDTWLGAEEFWYSDTKDRDLRMRHGYPQVYFNFLANVVQHGCQDMIIPVPCTSSIAARVLKAQGVVADLIYIDGSHHHDDVRSDIRSYIPLLRPGGVLFGDDCEQFSVRTALVEELCDYWDQKGPHWIWKNL
jgi:hypothetical protein